MTDAVLTINAGSSSIKFSLFGIGDGDALSLAAHGQVDGIGSSPRFVARDAAGHALEERCWTDPDEAFETLLGTVMTFAEGHLDGATLIAVGHRVVHGGADHYRPERITAELLAVLERLSPLAPLHQPHNLAPIRALLASHSDLPQIACFDTGFHHTVPAVATRFALPREYEAAGVRRYGFHGLSYEYIARRLQEIAPDLAQGRVITAHLGNGASLCATRAGRSIDTTMGFTALDGLMMGTRCGAIDPGAILYMLEEQGLAAKDVEDILYRKSGLLGVSGGLASDMRTLLASSDPRAREAIELFVYRIGREIGALTSSLGGLDGLVFTAGIGEHAPPIRAMVCARMGWLGVVLDDAANDAGAPIITAPESRVVVRVIPTDEEAMIARHSLETIRPGAAR